MCALAGGAAGLNLLAKAVRWRLMLRFQTGISVSVRFALSSIVSGVAASSLAPGRALDLGKPLLFHQAYGGPVGKALVATVAEKALDLLVLVALLAGAALVLPDRLPVAPGVLGLFLVLVLSGTVALFALPSRVAGVARRCAGRLPVADGVRRRLSAAIDTVESGLGGLADASPALLALSAAALGCEVARTWAVLGAVGVDVSPAAAAVAFGASVLLGLASFVPGGTGVTEVSAVGLLRAVGPPGALPGSLAAGVLLDRVLSYYLLVAAGSAVLLFRRRGGPVSPVARVEVDAR